MHTRRVSAILAGVLCSAGMACVSCATMSLQSPKPMEKGKVGIGVHAGFFLEPTGVDGDGQDASSPPVVQGTLQVGLGRGMKLGLNLGNLEGEAVFKYGFMSPEKPLQISLIAAAGLLQWEALDINAGALSGYTIADVLRPYVGYRHHLLPELDLSLGGVIGGMEILPSKKVGFMFEVNYTIAYTSGKKISLGELGDLSIDESFHLTAISGGIVLRP